MKKIIYTLILTLVIGQNSALAWGKKGHDVICHIAERNLSKKAMQRVTQLLDGRSMVYYSNWMDNASNTDEYKHTKTWHYINMADNESVATTDRLKSGDVLSAVTELEAVLRDGAANSVEQSVALKMFIHLVGDMHQPMHVSRREDLGGNRVPVLYFSESTNLHTAWDTHIVMGAHEWSYTEWGDQIDRVSTTQREEIIEGNYEDWTNETHTLAVEIYRATPSESRIYYDYMSHYTPIVEQQLLRGGLRLATILNEIYK
ncbi:MAG: S1/P1 nuclease [Rikenellaceae bacterium]